MTNRQTPAFVHPRSRTEPTLSLLQGCDYVKADHTNIRATFDRARRKQCESSSSSGISVGSIDAQATRTLTLAGLPTDALVADFHFEKFGRQ